MKLLLFFQFVVISTLIGIHLASAGSATLSQNGFSSIVVAIGTSVLEGTSTTNEAYAHLVNQIQDLMNKTSAVLYSATGNRLYFNDVVTVVPENWNGFVVQSTRRRVGRDLTTDMQNFDTADIRLDQANAAYGELPYTQQSGFCGERGNFIHITPGFINGEYDTEKFGASEKLLAREWVKYFFGVYDEEGYAFDNMFPVKYFAAGSEAIINTCNATHIEFTGSSCSDQGNIQGLPQYCNINVDQRNGRNQNVNSSLMSLPITPITTTFCTDETHNNDAPNKQNIMCDGRSIMNIILSNPEVVDPGDSFKAPTFAPTRQFTNANAMLLGIIWDNMAKDRTTLSALPAYSKFIYYDFPNGSYAAFAQTNGADSTPSVIQLNNDDERDKFITDYSPQYDDKSKPRNLMTAFNTITNVVGQSYASNVKAILIIGDREIDVSEWSDFCPNAVKGGFQVHLISYNSLTVSNYRTSDCIGQAIFIEPDVPPYDASWTQPMQDCYMYLLQRKQIDEFARGIPNIVAPNLYGPPQTFFENVYFNSSQGDFYVSPQVYTNTNMTDRFYIETCDDPLYFSDTKEFFSCSLNNANCNKPTVLTPPYGYIFCPAILNSTQSQVSFNCTVLPYQVQPEDTIMQFPPFVVYSVGQPINAIVDYTDPKVTPQIYLNSWVVTKDSSSSYTSVRIFARLVRGTTPIYNALVVASVTTSQNVTNVTLKDDGSGNPDVTKQDGVYSAYFTQFTFDSVYTVSVTATDNGLAAVYPTVQYAWLTNSQQFVNQVMPGFVRVVSAGSFSATPFTGNPSSQIPPGRIMDLQVQSSDSSSVVLQWTAPGADLDYGPVTEYFMKCSINKDDFNTTELFTSDDYKSGISPVSAGLTQTHTINGDVDGETHYCSLIASDGNLFSPASNVVIYSIVQNGLTAGQIAGISIGVIIIIIIIVAVAVIVYFKCLKKDKKETPSPVRLDDDDKLKPIQVDAVPMDAIHQPGHGLENESAQKHSRPASTHNLSNSFTSESTLNTTKMSNGAMLTFRNDNSRNSSPKPIPPPKVPSPITVIEVAPAPVKNIVLNVQPLHTIERQPSDNNVFFINNPDVARPVQLSQTAIIQDTGDYQDSAHYKNEIPVYNHLLSKGPNMYTSGLPPTVPKKGYHDESLNSSSSSSSSSSGNTTRSPRHNTQV